jgi:hypothetical protein
MQPAIHPILHNNGPQPEQLFSQNNKINPNNS